MTNLLALFLRKSRGTMVLAQGAAVVSGLCSAALLFVINTALHRAVGATSWLVWVFIALLLAKLLVGTASQILSARLSERITGGLRLELSDRMLATPLRRLEQLGGPALGLTLINDVQAIGQALSYIRGIVISGALGVGCAVYLAWLAPTMFVVALSGSVFGIWSYRRLAEGAFRALELARDQEQALFRHLRDLTGGIKELKLHRQRRHSFLTEHMRVTTAALEHHHVAAVTRFGLADNWCQLLIFAIIGGMLFASRELGFGDGEVLSGYILTCIYLVRPLGNVMNALPMIARGTVALRKIEDLGLSLSAEVAEPDGDPDPEPVSWRRLTLNNVVWTYGPQDTRRPFVLGPIDLTVSKGEFIFVVGGNGGGKSTLVKVLTGLYRPAAGEITLDDRVITDANRDWYRQRFAAVFADFHLFDSLLGLSGDDLDGRAKTLLKQLQLDRDVSVAQGTFSTTALSQGQRRRLALLTAYLEDRSIYVFDEWASDQDAQFQEIFYRHLLPELRARGKAIVVVSHDERYFHLADRVVVLDEGRLVSSTRAWTMAAPDGERLRL